MATQKSKLFSTKFRNWLLYLVVSRQDLKAIAGYTLQALRQDGPRFQPQVALLQPLYDGLDTGLTARAGAGAARASHTLLAETVFGLIKQFMKRAYKRNFAALEEDNPTLYKEFFPAGRSEYTNASRQSLGTVFDRFIETLTARQAAVPGGAALLPEAQALAQQYATARQAQDERKTLVKTASTGLDADETDLLTELFGAYAALLAHYYRTPERVADYFDFSVLPPSARGTADAPAPAGPSAGS